MVHTVTATADFGLVGDMAGVDMQVALDFMDAMKVLHRIAEAWASDRAKISESGNKIMAALGRSAATASAEGTGKVDAKLIDAAYQQIARSYDAREGGFGGAPKFPRPVTLNFLFRAYNRSSADSEAGEAALGMALFTLRKMAAGGMHGRPND